MIIEKQGYAYNDLTVVPEVISNISSRSECNPFYINGYLPLFTAPMSTVVCEENIKIWKENKITPILPRNISYNIRKEYLYKGEWVAISLKEAEDIFVYGEKDDILNNAHFCIDIANGHMKKLLDICEEIKNKYPECTIMAGNIANPITIKHYNKVGIDYVRVGIGGGAGCITSPQTSIHYPMASLIDACRQFKDYEKLSIKIVADGGIRVYGDVIKALALGADYVMIGSVFASLFESAARFYLPDKWSPGCYSEQFRLDFGGNEYTVYDLELSEDLKRAYIGMTPGLHKSFYGMSTKKAQKEIAHNAKLKTSEGCSKLLECKHTINQWVENFEHYMKSAMSYTNSLNLEDFIGNVQLIVNSAATQNSVNK